MIVGLLESINDKNVEVQESISESMVLLGKKKAEFVLKTTYLFLTKNLSIGWVVARGGPKQDAQTM